MTIANVHQAKTNLSKLLNAAADGDEVIITRRGGKVTRFKIQPIENARKAKLFGALKGKIIFSPDYDKADEEILSLFEESISKSE
ncbi:MAG TPA: type II toxin-antitoxin system prevent-host-death family antitoxin [Candidatus Saccharimonadales bacterium]|nr:type II toxin-antitoxin system prevent-host-death family antitoxin [Candidatus Saccharimonadales bacterium]